MASPSTAANDMGRKRGLNARLGIVECWCLDSTMDLYGQPLVVMPRLTPMLVLTNTPSLQLPLRPFLIKLLQTPDGLYRTIVSYDQVSNHQ